MVYYDRIYGKVKIEEPVILELIKSPPLQRLKGIDQAGYSPLYFKLQSLSSVKKVTRFEHSLGVFILLKRFNAPFKEQIAGLIHDASHTAFSHCIDYALDKGSEKNQDYQDHIFEKFVKRSKIPSILKKYKLDTDYILNEANFPLKEKPLPDLCADRIDYSLRDAVSFKTIERKKVNYFLNNLMVENNLWVFKNFRSAKRYAELFLKLNTVHYSGFPTAITFRTVGDLLRYALDKHYLSKKGLFTTNKEIIEKLKKKLKCDQGLKLLFERIEGKVKFENNPKDYNAHVFCKSRIVDPLFKMRNKIKRLSEVDKNWAKIVREESKPKEYFIKFER